MYVVVCSGSRIIWMDGKILSFHSGHVTPRPALDWRAFRCDTKVDHGVAAYQRVFFLGALKSMPDKPGLYKVANMANTFQLLPLISLVMSAMTGIE